MEEEEREEALKMEIGKIVAIREVLNEDLSVNCFEVVIDINTLPDLKLGVCEVKQ